jgi:magnesium-transporting ATPase (P-type)
MKDIYYQQAIDIGIYSNNNNLSDHFELLINNLSNKYNSYDSRYIVGLWVPIFSVAFLIIYFLFSIICKFKFFIFNSNNCCFNSCRFWIIIVFVIIIAVISFFIYHHKKTIYKAIQAQEDFLISIKKNEIKNALKSLLDKDLVKKE